MLQNANFSNFRTTFKAQIIRISEKLFYIRDLGLLKITYMSLFSDFINY